MRRRELGGEGGVERTVGGEAERMMGGGGEKVGSNEVDDSFKNVPATPAILQ